MSDSYPSSSSLLKKNGSRVSAIRIEIRIPWQAMLSGRQWIELTE
jgi:hypothetical protein